MDYNAEAQYQSMIRYYEVIRRLATDIGKTVVIGDYAAVDATKSFFVECYHFKDWLKKDSRITRPQDVEDCINASHSLSLAADLCNSLKHAGLDKTPRSGMNLDRINMAYSLDLPSTIEPGQIKFERNPSDGDTITISYSNRAGRPIATAKVVLTVGGKTYDALGVAAECVNDWDDFLLNHKIRFAKS